MAEHPEQSTGGDLSLCPRRSPSPAMSELSELTELTSTPIISPTCSLAQICLQTGSSDSDPQAQGPPQQQTDIDMDPPPKPFETVIPLVEAKNAKMAANPDPIKASPVTNQKLRRGLVLAKVLLASKSIADDGAGGPPAAPSTSEVIAVLHAEYTNKPEVYKNGVPDNDVSALGKLIKTNSDDDLRCHFCHFNSATGITDATVLLSLDVGEGFCEPCYASCNTFGDMIASMDEQHLLQFATGSLAEKKKNIAALKELSSRNPLKEFVKENDIGPKPRDKVLSKIDGKDITEFKGNMHCRSAPLGLINVLKTLICPGCYIDKEMVIAHGRHLKFKKILQKGFCDMCYESAAVTCAGCPLSLCLDCEGLLTSMCKGWLDNLFYFYGRKHLRNDAFLLRSDGGGY